MKNVSKNWLLIPLCVIGLTIGLVSNFLLKKEGSLFWVGMVLSLVGLIVSSLIFSFKINGLKNIFSIIVPLISSLLVWIGVGTIYVGTFNCSDDFMYWWLTNIVGLVGGITLYSMIFLLLLTIPLHKKYDFWSKPQKSDFIDILLFIFYAAVICFTMLATWWFRFNYSSYSWIGMTFLIPPVQAIIFLSLRQRTNFENE